MAAALVLYIPLCLYFNVRCLCGHCDSDFLYIPLCLYFNQRNVHAALFCFTFTFHYVSILILTCTFLPEFLSSFTFHYVSILIRPPLPRSASLLFYHFLSTSSIARVRFCIFGSIFVCSGPFRLIFPVFSGFCRPYGFWGLSEVDSQSRKSVASSDLPQNSFSSHFSCLLLKTMTESSF